MDEELATAFDMQDPGISPGEASYHTARCEASCNII